MTEDIHDLKPWWELGGLPPWWVWALLLAGVAAALWVWWRRRRRCEEAAPVEPAPDPGAPIRELLGELERWSSFDEEGVRRFHFLLSDASRRWLEWRLGVPATDLSLEELSERLPARLRGADSWLGVLGEMDQVKFARHRPPADQCREVLARTRRLMEPEVGP